MLRLKKFPTLDLVPENARDTAQEMKDGTFVADIDEPDANEDVTKLSGALKAVRKERDGFETRARTAETALGDATKKLEVYDASGKQSDEKIASMLTKWDADKTAAVAAAVEIAMRDVTPLREKVSKYELDDKLASAFRNAGGRDVRVLRALVLAKQDGWTLVDGVAVRKDGDDITTTTPDEYFSKTFRADMPEWYEGSKADGGGGGGTGSGGGGPSSTKSPTQWSSDERRQFIDANGLPAYSQLLDASMVPKPK